MTKNSQLLPKNANFVGGQIDLTLVTLLQNSAKITKIRQTEDILGKFGLQASSCIHFWLKTVSSCRKMQIFVGGQNELTLVTLLQNSEKNHHIRHTEDILGKFGLQASSCIHFWLKTVSSCRKMQIFVGGQNELTLVTLLQNSAKITTFVTLKTFWVNLVFKHLVASIFG